MKDNFDIYEYRDQLKSKQIKETLTGMDASNKIIAYLRDNIYPKLDDDGMDEFVIEMCNHFDVEPPNYRLPEGTGPRQKVVALDDLTFDQLGPKPMFGFDAQNNDDSSTKLHNDDD